MPSLRLVTTTWRCKFRLWKMASTVYLGRLNDTDEKLFFEGRGRGGGGRQFDDDDESASIYCVYIPYQFYR